MKQALQKVILPSLKRYHRWVSESPSTRDVRLMWYQLRTKGVKRFFNVDNYDALFYQEHLPLKPAYWKFAQILDRHLNPQTVADFGCGNGFLLEHFLKKSIPLLGTEYSQQALNYIDPELKSQVLLADLRTPVDFQKKFDLVVSTEVGEHLPKHASEVYVRTLIRHARRYIVFSAARPGQWGDGHINCQPKEFWKQLFLKHRWQHDPHSTTTITQAMEKNPIIVNKLSWIIPNLMIVRRK